jgi:hypothetical protein
MNKEDRIRDEVEKTLSVYDRIKNIDGNPFMYTRIRAEIDARSRIKGKSAFGIALKAIPVLLFVVLFSVNIVSVIHYLNSSSNSISSERENYISSFAEEYNLSSSYNYIKDINIED